MLTCTERQKLRRHSRGAATLEGLVVALVLLGMFFGVVGLGGLYRAKLRAMQEARFRNTYNATNACKIAGPSLAAFAFPQMEGEPATPDDAVSALHDIGRLAVTGPVSRAEAHGSFGFGPKGPALVKGLHGSVSAHSVMACNPIESSGNPLEVAAELAKDLGGALSQAFSGN